MDEAAFEHIAGSLRERALSASRALGLNEMDADDVAQDTLLKLWSMRQDLGRYRSLPALSTVVARHLRRNRRPHRHQRNLGTSAHIEGPQNTARRIQTQNEVTH